MVITKIEGKTICLYRKWVWLGVEWGHRDLIPVFHISCFFCVCWCVFMQIDMQATLLLQAIVFLHTTTSKCSRKPISSPFSFWQMSFWVLVNISYAVVTAWSGNNISGLYVHATNMSVNTCISETGSNTNIVVLFLAFEDLGILGVGSTNHSPPAIFF